VIALCRDNGIPVFEKSFSLTDVYGSDEAFVTGTFAGVVPVHTVDGRRIGDRTHADPGDTRGPMVERLQALYRDLVARDAAARREQTPPR
jgi:branched-chain amino acid aminotransferase